MASPCQLSTPRLQLFGLRTLIFHSVKVYLTVQLIVSCFVDVANGITCKKTDVCKCEIPGVMTVDLSSLSDVQGGRYTYPLLVLNIRKVFTLQRSCEGPDAFWVQ